MPPVVVDGELAIDGAIVNNLPVDIMQQKPVGKIIAVDFTAPVPDKVDYEELASPWVIWRGGGCLLHSVSVYRASRR
jgi:NTE family protein